MSSEPMIAIGRSRSGFLDSSDAGRDGVEPDIGEEDHPGRYGDAAGAPFGANGDEVVGVERGERDDDEEQQDDDLDHHHDGVGAGALLGAADQQHGDGQDDEHRRQVEHPALGRRLA